MPDPNDWNASTIAEFGTNEGRVTAAGLAVASVHDAETVTEYVTPMMYIPNDRDDSTIYVFATKGGAPTNPELVLQPGW